MDDLFAVEAAVVVVSLTADLGDARDLREVDVSGAGDPDGAADGAAVGAVKFRPVGARPSSLAWMASKQACCRDEVFPVT